MKKKMISWAFLSSFLFTIGCYNTQTITRDEIEASTKEELKAEAEQVDITVCMKDSSEYKFLKDNYRIQGDTLTGFGVQTVSGNDQHFQGAIAFADIASLKTSEFSLARTIAISALPFVAFGVFLLVLGTSLH